MTDIELIALCKRCGKAIGQLTDNPNWYHFAEHDGQHKAEPKPGVGDERYGA